MHIIVQQSQGHAMELRHLRYFRAVADAGSCVQAARDLRVAQPALSKQIHNLETELGVTLFYRLPRGIRLTAAGEAFLGSARNTLDAAGGAGASARQAGKDGGAEVRVAHREPAVYNAILEDLLPAVRNAP